MAMHNMANMIHGLEHFFMTAHPFANSPQGFVDRGPIRVVLETPSGTEYPLQVRTVQSTAARSLWDISGECRRERKNMARNPSSREHTADQK